MLVGANGQLGAGSPGAAYLFDTSGNLLQTFLDPNGSPDDVFGGSVAALGRNVLVGANGDSFDQSGAAVYLYQYAAPTMTAIAPSANPSTYGQSVTFTAAVTAGGTSVTSGTVTFADGSTIVASNVPVDVSGQASFSISTLTAAASPHAIVASYSGTSAYAPSSAGVSQIVNKTTPTITWPNPADIAYGTALTGTQLDASASVMGTFIYTPPAGTVLAPGSNQILSTTFTPADTAD